MKVLHQKHYVNFDYENQIEKEYKDCLKDSSLEKRPGVELIKKWVVDVISKSVRKHSGILPKDHDKALRKIKFDKDDLYFIAVCHRGHCKILVAEESDYNEKVNKYLNQQMGINVHSIEKAIDAC